MYSVTANSIAIFVPRDYLMHPKRSADLAQSFHSTGQSC